MKTILPDSFVPYFWDVKFKTLNLENHRMFILKRLLDRGDTRAILWLKENYKISEVINFLKKTRDISRKSASYWTNILDIDPLEVACLHKPYTRIPFGV